MVRVGKYFPFFLFLLHSSVFDKLIMDGQVFEGQLRGVEVKVGCETFSGFITNKALESMVGIAI